MSHRVKIVTTLVASPGMASELEGLMARHARLARAYPGVLRWDAWQDLGAPERYVVDQLYVDEPAAEAYQASEIYSRFLSDLTSVTKHQEICCKPLVL
ncbi:putative quinol monooxygenase [Caulobacter sp. 602-1]|uniref:putative quinol monooxygenase n=1 Tax=Caulobacter sp. 602-1 TaxID=2492472 RepID=UPI000F63FF8B|nr:antibiotic biosynthesis monooxygenase family protein [Caulobacter sp. 602-1]RRN63851.1 antibiotic biosynthesis monooxygenase [Caulobacter sp. 602-1]